MEFLHDAMPVDVQRDLVDLANLATEIFAHDTVYDFGESNLAQRIRDAMWKLLPTTRYLRPPPAEIIMFERKIVGTFLLLRRLRARVNCRALALEFQETSGSALGARG